MNHIFSFYASNMNPEVMRWQKKVIETLNPEVKLWQIATNSPHGHNIDTTLWYGLQIIGTDKVLFLDVDCIPVNRRAIPNMFKDLEEYALSGNVQRSNHIENDEHLFVAPSCMAINVSKFEGKVSSSMETKRADVSEELTFLAEERNLPVKMYLPKKFEKAPLECEYWALKKGMPNYGRFSWFDNDFMHAFQMRTGKDIDRFIEICREVIK